MGAEKIPISNFPLKRQFLKEFKTILETLSMTHSIGNHILKDFNTDHPLIRFYVIYDVKKCYNTSYLRLDLYGDLAFHSRYLRQNKKFYFHPLSSTLFLARVHSISLVHRYIIILSVHSFYKIIKINYIEIYYIYVSFYGTLINFRR